MKNLAYSTVEAMVPTSFILPIALAKQHRLDIIAAAATFHLCCSAWANDLHHKHAQGRGVLQKVTCKKKHSACFQAGQSD